MNEIFKRVSVRNFTEQKVEEEKLQQILKAAMQAPSAGNQMPWEFYVVTDKAKIEELSQCSQYAGCAANAPAVIVPCYRTEDLKFPEFDQIDTAIATEHILLESVSLGLGAVWLAIAPIEERMKKAKKLHQTVLTELEDGRISKLKKKRQRSCSVFSSLNNTRINWFFLINKVIPALLEHSTSLLAT